MLDRDRSFSLTEDLDAFVDGQVASGRHTNGSEVVREALRRYQNDISQEQAAYEAYLRRLVEEGEADIATGRYVALNTPEELEGYILNCGRGMQP